MLFRSVSQSRYWSIGSIGDYFGLPTVGQVSAGKSVTHSALPFRAYNLIFNEWFRDENLSPAYLVNTGDGPDPDSNYVLLNRGKRHDYFTSCLPWPQKGPAVNLPLGSSAPVKSGGNFVSNAIDLQSSAGGFTRLNLGAVAPFNVTQASAITSSQIGLFSSATSTVVGSSVQNPSGGNTVVATSSNSSSGPRFAVS